MGGLGSPCRTVWNGSTEADLGIFHAHSKPFWFDPVTLWDLPLAALQPEGLKMRSYFEIFHAHSQNLFDLTPLDLETGWDTQPLTANGLKNFILEKFHAWLLFELLWYDPVRRDVRVAQKRLITRSLRLDQGQLVDCHDSSSNKAKSGDDQNMVGRIWSSSLSSLSIWLQLTAYASIGSSYTRGLYGESRIPSEQLLVNCKWGQRVAVGKTFLGTYGPRDWTEYLSIAKTPPFEHVLIL